MVVVVIVVVIVVVLVVVIVVVLVVVIAVVIMVVSGEAKEHRLSAIVLTTLATKVRPMSLLKLMPLLKLTDHHNRSPLRLKLNHHNKPCLNKPRQSLLLPRW